METRVKSHSKKIVTECRKEQKHVCVDVLQLYIMPQSNPVYALFLYSWPY